MANKNGFQTIESDIEEMNEQIRSHRRAIARRILCVVGILIIIFAATQLYLALRTYSSYRIDHKTERRDSEAVSFDFFGKNIVKYTNDGAICMDGQNMQIWNQSYEMTTPTLAKSDDYLAIFDCGGTEVYIISESGTQKHLEMARPIRALSVSNQGTVAVLMKDEEKAVVKLYNKEGDELANGEFYLQNGAFPVDVALSFDAKKMALSLVDASEGKMKSVIRFYNFGSVGKNEIDNNVGNFEYEEMLIPEIEYVSNDKMVALSDSEIMIFEGSEKPQLASEQKLEIQPRSIIYNKNYIATASQNEEGYQISLYNFRGKEVMKVETDIMYRDFYFLENGEMCISDGNSVELYTTHSIRKFHYVFDTDIYRILSQGSGTNYIFILSDSTQEVHLR
ncbi:DUF5711 family protein [Agathobacter ruminis]|nr:DUF5711 family protein [Agathobacter ruminis]